MQLCSLDFETLQAAYRSGTFQPADVVRAIFEKIEDDLRPEVWIHLRSRAESLADAEALAHKSPDELPLYGLPFAVKDSIDIAGMPTTVACPEFAYIAKETATVIAKLQAAGAILIGKTNLDQFATGLVGVRSPYGACKNPFNARYMAGGSSSGSAVALAEGFVSFSIGTDTAGSGRVPAGCNNIVGLKPTCGLLSTKGVAPACKSIDCVSIFAFTVEDAGRVLDVAQGFDAANPYSRKPARVFKNVDTFRFGVPDALEFFGDEKAGKLFAEAVERVVSLGGEPVVIDFTPFRQAADLLYSGPWIAERWEALRDFHARNADAFLPITRQIIERGANFSAADLFHGLHELEALKRVVDKVWKEIDVLFVPTMPTIYTLDEIEEDPILLNTRLGYYTNFANLLDCAGIAVPGGFRTDGLPFGVTFLAPAWHETMLAKLGSRYHRAVGGTLGATAMQLADIPLREKKTAPAETIPLAVLGAHLSGLPLNYQLTECGATLLRKCRTAPRYRLYALPNTTPPKPGLVRVEENGAPIELEVWAMPQNAFAQFVATIPPPLGVGTISLEDETGVKGFLCESYAVKGARDITDFGGWRNFLAASIE